MSSHTLGSNGNGPLNTRAVSLDAAILVGCVAVYGFLTAALAFLRLWGLMIREDWLVPLVSMMAVQFVAGCLVANAKGLLTRETVKAELTIKALIVLAYITGFSVQRMFEPDGEGGTSFMGTFGHATAGALIGFEFLRVIRIFRTAGMKLGPFEAALVWFDKTFAGEVRSAEIRDAKVDAAICERRAAKEEYWATGEVKSHPAINTLSGEVPCPPQSDTDPDMPAEPK